MSSHRYLVRAHDGHHHGGHILPQPNRPLIAGKAQSLVGDLVYCARCTGYFPIIGWSIHHPLAIGTHAAEGMVTACGAILQASQKQQSMAIDFLALAHQFIVHFENTPTNNKPAFFDLSHPDDQAHHPFSKAILIKQLKARLNQTLDAPNILSPSIQQGPSSLCGPACFAYCLLQDRPDIYVSTIMTLWQYGEAQMGTLNLRPSRHTKQPKQFTWPASQETKLPIVDWILLASLKDSSNQLLPYDTPHRKIAGITFWFHLNKWFHAVGAQQIQHHYSPLGSKHDRHTQKIKQLNTLIPSGNHVVALIGAGMLTNGQGRFSNHWVVLTHPLEFSESPPQSHTLISAQLFSWGQCAIHTKPTLTFQRFKQHFYGAWIYTNIP